LVKGLGKVSVGENVHLGYFPSPYFYETTMYIEARGEGSSIVIGNNVYINNGFKVICDKTTIVIGNKVLMGTNVEIIDSDFHCIHPDERNNPNYKCLPVFIGDNVFIGSNVKILKGVTIGNNSVIANNSVVTKSIGENLIAGGNPAKNIKSVYE
jgi:acetyltransferase-like isoleucine patch superfamily enzyme